MSQAIFNSVEFTQVPTNTFDLSHDVKLSMNMGLLIPVFTQDCIPGDKWSIQASQLIRFAPLTAPIMHRVSLYMHYFKVPNRLLWATWEPFITGGKNGTGAPVSPYVTLNSVNSAPGTLLDYMGCPSLESAATYQINAIPLAAYQRVYNEYYRDQNLINQVNSTLVDGDNNGNTDLFTMRKRAWQHDYFTSGLPWTQRGDEATIPLGTTAPILFTEDTGGSSTLVKPGNVSAPLEVDSGTGSIITNNGGSLGVAQIDNSAYLSADLSQATAATINDLRKAFRLQEFLERNARGGARYIENIYAQFGVKSSDARLQRPEYLGGGSSPITFSEILQTSGSPIDPATGYTPTPQGTMAGHGISAGSTSRITTYCEEHCTIIGILSIMPKTAYQQGIPKKFLMRDRFDYPWPSFANIGEQPILNCEIYADDTTDPMGTFAYAPRYAEHKFKLNTVHGDFKTSLDFWHMGRIFTSKPALNQAFIEADPTERIFAIDDLGATHKLYAHIYFDVRRTAKLPFFGTPTI